MTMIDIPKGLETRICVLGKGVLREVPALAREHWPGLKPLLVADGNTWKAVVAAALPPGRHSARTGVIYSLLMTSSGILPSSSLNHAVPMYMCLGCTLDSEAWA